MGERIVQHHKHGMAMARLWCLMVVGAGGKEVNTRTCPHGHIFMLVCRDWGFGEMEGELPSMKTRAVFSCSAQDGLRSCWIHKTRLPYRCILCVLLKEIMPTAKTHPHRCVFAIGVEEKGWEMPPNTKNAHFFMLGVSSWVEWLLQHENVPTRAHFHVGEVGWIMNT